MIVPKNVFLVKFPRLDEVDEALLRAALERFNKRIGGDAALHLSLKQYHKGGLRAQHEVHGKLIVGSKSYFAEYEGWQLIEVVQHVLKTLEREVAKEESYYK